MFSTIIRTFPRRSSDPEWRSPVPQDDRDARIGAVFPGVAFGTAAFAAAVTVAPLIAVDTTASTAFSGLPVAAIVAGTAAGAMLMSGTAHQRGSRAALMAGYLVGAAGAAAAVIATVTLSFGRWSQA